MSRSLIVLPEDSSQALVKALAEASHSLRIKMFVFSDPVLLQAVIAARKRGLTVRVILNAARRSGKDENSESRSVLRHAGIEVLDGNPAFDLTHEKSMVVDERLAYIMSLNWQTKNLTETRDYAVVTSHTHEVHEVMECFDADWARGVFTPGDHSHLIWCVGNGRQRLGKLIDAARHAIWLQNERYQDQVIIEHLVRARVRGVNVHIMAPPPHKLKKDKLIEGVGGLRILSDVGAKIHRLKHIKLHAKMLLIDGERAIVGSINLSPGSFDSRRELAIELDDEHAIRRLRDVVKSDWESSHVLDLSDQALVSELEEYDENVAEDLALGQHSNKPA
jgi:phosphatidylserine/phosphatidylglycerophosphate/cardiolipin synthase-like enzyme